MLRHWHEFLFQNIDVRQYALLRIGLGSLIVLYLINLMPLFASQFGPEGWLDAKTDLDLYHAGSWSILFLIESTEQAKMFFWLVLVSALAFTAGFLTRTTGFITLVGLISLWNRNPLIMDGDDAILRIMLFYLLLSPSGNALSIDARIRQRKRSAEIWPLRMIRGQLILVYFISGWVKFHSPEWLDGTVLQYVLIHPEYSRWNMSVLMEYPFFLYLLSGLSFLVMWWELLFPVLVLWRFSRSTAIVAGVAFHTALLLLMHLRLFSVIMLVLYIAWIPQPLPGWIAKISNRIKPRRTT
jgi:hypothetical protein